MTNHVVPYIEAFYAQQPVASPAPQAQGNSAVHNTPAGNHIAPGHQIPAGNHIPAGMAEPGMNRPVVEPKGEKQIPSDEGILEPRYDGFVYSPCRCRKDGKTKNDFKCIPMNKSQNELKKLVNERPSNKKTVDSVGQVYPEVERWLKKHYDGDPSFKWTWAYEKKKGNDLTVIIKRKAKREKPILNAAPKQFTGNDAAGNVYASVVPNEPQRQPQDIDPSYGNNIQQQQQQQQPPLANTSAHLLQRLTHGLPRNFNVQPGYAQVHQQQQQQPPLPPPPNYPAGFAPIASPNHQVWHEGPPRYHQPKHEVPQFGGHPGAHSRDLGNHGGTGNAMPRDNEQYIVYDNPSHGGPKHTHGYGQPVRPKGTGHNDMAQRLRFHYPDLPLGHNKYYKYDTGRLTSDLKDDSTSSEESEGTMSDSYYDSRSASPSCPSSFDETDYSGPPSSFHKSKSNRQERSKGRPTKAAPKAHPKTTSHNKHSGSGNRTKEKRENIARKEVNDTIHPAPASPLPPPVPPVAAAPSPPPPSAPSIAPSTAAAAEGVLYVLDPQVRPVNPTPIHYQSIVTHHERPYCEDPRRGRTAHECRPCYEASRHRRIHEEPLCHARYSSSYESLSSLSSYEGRRRGSYGRRSSHKAHCRDCLRHHCHCNY